MRSASERLPSLRILLASAVTSGELYTGSVTSCRFAAGPLRGISALLLLRAVPAASLLAVADALGVQGAADDLVTDAGQVAHAPAAHQHDRVLLQVVPDARDVRGDLDLAGQPDPRHLAQRRVGLLRRRRVDARAHAPALRALLERRRLVLRYLVLAALADQLLDRGQPRLRNSRRFSFRGHYTAQGPKSGSCNPSSWVFLTSAAPRGRACRRDRASSARREPITGRKKTRAANRAAVRSRSL